MISKKIPIIKMETKQNNQTNCTIYKTLDLIGKKWALLIILTIYKLSNSSSKLQNGIRYSEIKNNLKYITSKILSTRLKELEKEKIITKSIDHSSIPIKSYYNLTESGKDLVIIITDIKTWGLKWKFENNNCNLIDCKNCNIKN
jgi:DNA-binding HxlR family transcriptional regulator